MNPDGEPIPDATPSRDRWLDLPCCAVLTAVSLLIGLWNVNNSGPLWPDSARYANAGAMIRDWIRSGSLTQPMEFAKENYRHYPAFNVPFHPPGYPGLLALLFLVDFSYFGARLFVALSLAVAACLFYTLLRRHGWGPLAGLIGGLLLITTPEVAHWTRDNMSEVPSLPFMVGASLCFLAWLGRDRWWLGWLAFALALMAFMCRVTSCGMLPGWFLFVILSGQSRRLLSPHLWLPALLFLGLAGCYFVFASRFGRFEASADGRGSILSLNNFSYFFSVSPKVALWGTTFAAIVGVVLTSAFRRRYPLGLFWLCWLGGFAVFKLLLATTDEVRHAFVVMPALAGLAACVLRPGSHRLAFWSLALGAVALNFFWVLQTPAGLVGYDPVAERLAVCDKPGNVLTACWEDQDLMFRYRTRQPPQDRLFHRSDRTLSVRVAAYARVPDQVVAQTSDDVLSVIRKGRVRYLVTWQPDEPERDQTPADLVLAHQTALTGAGRGDFRGLGEFPLSIAYGDHGRTGRIFLWEYTGSLPDGPSELVVPIPTAGMELPPEP